MFRWSRLKKIIFNWPFKIITSYRLFQAKHGGVYDSKQNMVEHSQSRSNPFFTWSMEYQAASWKDVGVTRRPFMDLQVSYYDGYYNHIKVWTVNHFPFPGSNYCICICMPYSTLAVQCYLTRELAKKIKGNPSFCHLIWWVFQEQWLY